MSVETDDFAPPIPEGFIIQDADSRNAAAAFLDQTNSESREEVPLIEEAPSGDSLLLAGVTLKGVHRKDAVVREFNGADEEYVARAQISTNPARFVEALLERGVENIGGVKPSEDLLGSLLVGDRDVLVLEIRKVTYGRTIDLDMICQQCGTESQVRVDLDEDIPLKQMTLDPSQKFYDVPLRSGRKAKVRLATGADQQAAIAKGTSNPEVTQTDLNTLTLSRVVMEYDDVPLSPKGAIETARLMSAGDRRDIIDFLNDNAPGPQYDKVSHACAVCQKVQVLGLSPAQLFPIY
jgi:hypothetical protein